ncbi:ABC transporter permease subunit [Mameliella alba]|uniref:hypothetical protein n=1 Tax=Mameliella alba TaxID=561184 RepID=UPI001112C7AA|nr:hypothetical protein [Mameliella alba]
MTSETRDLEEAALDLGASRLRVFFRITPPFLAPALAVGTAIDGMASMESYTPTMFAKGGCTLATEIGEMTRRPGGPLPGGDAAGTVILMLTAGFSAPMQSCGIVRAFDLRNSPGVVFRRFQAGHFCRRLARLAGNCVRHAAMQLGCDACCAGPVAVWGHQGGGDQPHKCEGVLPCA